MRSKSANSAQRNEPVVDEDASRRSELGDANYRSSKQPDKSTGETAESKLHQDRRQAIPYSASRDREPKRGLPSFGSIPQKLSLVGHHLPYFSYSGRAKNIDLVAPRTASGAAAKAQTRPLLDHHQRASQSIIGNRYHQLARSDGSASTSSTASSCSVHADTNARTGLSVSNTDKRSRSSTISSTSNSSGSNNNGLLSARRKASAGSSTLGQATATQSRRNSANFSNFSNLFPNEPIRVRCNTATNVQRAADPRLSPTSNINNKTTNSVGNQRRAASLVDVSRAHGRQLQADQPSGGLTPVQKDKRLLSTLSNHHRTQTPANGTNLLISQSPARMMRRQQPGVSPSGASRSRIWPAMGSSNVGRARPASASGHYATSLGAHLNQGRSPSTGSLMNRSPMSNYNLYQTEMESSNQRAGSQRAWRLGQKMSSSHPDLIMSEEPLGHQHQGAGMLSYLRNNSYQQRTGTMPTRGARPMSSQSAYYNSPGRFSLFHRERQEPSGGFGAPIRSSLAPPNEQLRRILGHRSSSRPRPVHLHPQWAYSRPFAHLQQAGVELGHGLAESANYLADQQDQDLGINVELEHEEPEIEPGPDGIEHEQLEGLGAQLNPGQAYEEDNNYYLGAGGSHLNGGLAGANPMNQLDLEPIDGADEPNAQQPIRPQFEPITQLADTQAIRAVDFHPSGEVYAVGSNSRMLRICAYPAEHELRRFKPTPGAAARPARVLFKFVQLHRGSIYCVAFSRPGHLLATGSNDQTVQLVRYNSLTHSPDGDEFRLTMHNGTIRDLCFVDDSTSGNSLLLSAGGGDNKIYVTDCDTVTPFQSMAGHTQMVMGLQHVAGAQFVSASYDKTVRFWDLRSRSCTAIVSAPPASGGGMGAPVCSLRVDPSGRLLATGHLDSTLMLYDIRGSRVIQWSRPHEDEIRAISFSPKSYYLLTAGYDGRLVLSDLQGDLTQPLPSVCVAETHDKIVQAKWHPADFTFVSAGADKTATLWAQPQLGLERH